MKKLPLTGILFLLSFGVFAQITSIMAGTYMLKLSDDTNSGYCTLSPGSCNFHSGSNSYDNNVDPYNSDSADYINDINNNPTSYFIQISGSGAFYWGGDDCDWDEYGTGTISHDFNHIYLQIGDYFDGMLQYSYFATYTRVPQFTQQQVDSIENILFPKQKSNNTSQSTVTIYPQTNPVTNILYFTINAYDLPSLTEVRIFDLYGRCMYQDNMPLQTGEQVGINVQNYSPGMYILEATGGKNVFYRLRFIKQ